MPSSQKYLFMCLKGFKLKPKTPKISKTYLKAKFRGCFSQVQQLNLKSKTMCTSSGYLSIDTNKLENSPSRLRKKKIAVKLFFFKSRIRETLNLLTTADSSTDIFVSAGVKKGADSIYLVFTPPPSGQIH